jgi:hypothetical protein
MGRPKKPAAPAVKAETITITTDRHRLNQMDFSALLGDAMVEADRRGWRDWILKTQELILVRTAAVAGALIFTSTLHGQQVVGYSPDGELISKCDCPPTYRIYQAPKREPSFISLTPQKSINEAYDNAHYGPVLEKSGVLPVPTPQPQTTRPANGDFTLDRKIQYRAIDDGQN